MTREEALASLPKKFRKEAARNLSGVRAALKACANEVEAALALPADAPPEQKAPAVETDDQALRLATWFARTYLEPKRVPTYSIEEIARHVAEEFAPVHASTPTLTLTREEVGKGLGWTSDKTGVYIPWDDFPKVADRLNAILAAKSQKGGDAKWLPNSEKESETIGRMSTDRARTEPVKANECDTPSAAWDRAIRRAEIEARKEGQVPRSEGGNLARTDACDNVANAIRALRGKYEEPKP